MIMNTPKVALAFNEVSFAFDDQYSLLLWGKMTSHEFAECLERINSCMANVSKEYACLGIIRGIVLTLLALSFFILPGIFAATLNPRNISVVVLASAGVCGLGFFCSTMLFIYLYNKIETKGANTVKEILAEFNKVCNSQGLNWRLVDSQLTEFETPNGYAYAQSTATLQQKHHMPKQWIEIEVTIPGYGFQHEYYQTPQFPTEYSVGVQYPFLKFKRKEKI